MKRIGLYLICFTILYLPVQAQVDKWSLEDCIAYALENNIRVKRAKLNSESSENNYLNSKLQILPSVNGKSGLSYNWGKTFSYDKLTYVDQNYLNFSLRANANVEAFTGLQKLNTIKQYKYSLLESIEHVESVKDEISLQLTGEFLQILLNQELLSLAENQYELSQLQVVIIKKKVEVGNEAKGSLLEMQAQAALNKSDMINASNNLKLSVLQITQTLDLDSVESFEIQVPDTLQIDEELVLQSPESVFTDAKTFMPSVKSAEFGLLSQEKGLAIARGMRSPILTLNFGESTRYSELATLPGVDTYSFKEQISDFENKNLDAELIVPIFRNWNIQNNINNAKINLEDSKLNLDLTKQVLYEDIQLAYTDVVTARENYLAMQESAMSFQKAFNYAEERFNIGILNSIDYNLAKNNLSQAQSDLLQAKYVYLLRIKILDFYMGKDLKL